jgi:hypothetical protein
MRKKVNYVIDRPELSRLDEEDLNQLESNLVELLNREIQTLNL